MNNTWFITAISCCYCITPILQNLRKYSNYIFGILQLLLIVLYIGVSNESILFALSWIYLYSISYYVPNISFKKIIQIIWLLVFFVTIAISIIRNYYGCPNGRMIKDFMGLLSVTIGVDLLSKIIHNRLPFIVDFFSKYSYEIYIVHYVILIGPLSVLCLFENGLCNIVVSLICIVLLTYLLVITNSVFQRLLLSKKNE